MEKTRNHTILNNKNLLSIFFNKNKIKMNNIRTIPIPVTIISNWGIGDNLNGNINLDKNSGIAARLLKNGLIPKIFADGDETMTKLLKYK